MKADSLFAGCNVMTHATRLCRALFALSLAPAVFAGPAVSPKVKPLMVNHVVPASKVVFAVAKTAPATDEDWREMERSALVLAEAGKQLKKLNPGGNEVWRRQARLLIGNATATVAAAKARDVNGLNQASEAVFETCAGCHKAFPVNP